MRSFAAAKRPSASERRRAKAAEERDWKLRKAIYQVRRCHRPILGDAPPELIEAGFIDPIARRVLDDWLLERGFDVGALDLNLDELDYEVPYGTSERGREGWRVIMSFLKEHDMIYSGGICNVFRLPAVHARMEELDPEEIEDVELVVIHDGGAHAPAFNASYQNYNLVAELDEQLQREAGLFLRPMSSWYSFVSRV